MRHMNGNCLVIGGFCTSVSDEICNGLRNAYACGASSSGNPKIDDVEKVLKGLEHCSDKEGFYDACCVCPYIGEEYGYCKEYLLKDAIAIIKQLRNEHGKA